MTRTPLSDIVTGKMPLTDALKALFASFATNDRPLSPPEHPPHVDDISKATPYEGDLTTEQLEALAELPESYREAAAIALRRYITHSAGGNANIVRATRPPGTVIVFGVELQQPAAT